MDGNWERVLGVSTLSTSSTPPLPPCDAEQSEDEEYDYSDDDDDVDEDDDDDGVYDNKCGLGCPFCSEDFDVLGLCCHIDVEHHKEAKAAICPVCGSTVETSMAVHLITQHETTLKMLCKKRFRNGGSRSALSFLKKELQDEYLRTPPKDSSPVNSSDGVETDSLLLSFIYNPQLPVKSETVNPSNEASLIRNSSQDCDSESRDIEMPALPDKNEEKTSRYSSNHVTGSSKPSSRHDLTEESADPKLLANRQVSLSHVPILEFHVA